MKFNNSPDIALPMDNPSDAAKFFRDVLGFETNEQNEYIQVKTEHYNLYLVNRDDYKSLLEFYVDDLEIAKNMCLEGGCKILKWDDNDHWLIHQQGFAFHLEQRPDS